MLTYCIFTRSRIVSTASKGKHYLKGRERERELEREREKEEEEYLHLAGHKVEKLWEINGSITICIHFINHILQLSFCRILSKRPHHSPKLLRSNVTYKSTQGRVFTGGEKEQISVDLFRYRACQSERFGTSDDVKVEKVVKKINRLFLRSDVKI